MVQGSLPKGAVPFVAEPSLLKLVATKPPDPIKLDDEGKEISDPKRKCTPAKVRPVPEKLVYRKMAKDGSCVFHAMAAGIKFVTGGKLDLSARELRARAVGHLRKYAETYSKQYDKKGPDGSDMPEFEDYLSAIAAESAYAGAMEVEALCRIYSIRVILVPENAAFPVEAYHLKEKKKIVVLWLTGVHIDLLLPEGADAAEKEGADTRKLRYPQELLEIAATPTIAYKVGGLSGTDLRRPRQASVSRPVPQVLRPARKVGPAVLGVAQTATLGLHVRPPLPRELTGLGRLIALESLCPLSHLETL